LQLDRYSGAIQSRRAGDLIPGRHPEHDDARQAALETDRRKSPAEAGRPSGPEPAAHLIAATRAR
jgi:hypothetical protein